MPESGSSLPLFDELAANNGDDADDDTRRLPELAPSADKGELSLSARDTPPAPAGSGALVRHAWPLLAVLVRLKRGAVARDAASFKDVMAQQIREFERRALSSGLDPRQIFTARYTLCTAIDEAVATSAWGGRSEWEQASLLSVFHGETWGGEKVFTLVEHALADPRRYTDLLELFYFVLALGFQGKFRLERDGTAAVEDLRDRLFDALQRHFANHPTLPTPPRASISRRRKLIRYVPVWSVAVVSVLVSLLFFALLDYMLESRASVVAHHLDQVAATASVSRPR